MQQYNLLCDERDYCRAPFIAS